MRVTHQSLERISPAQSSEVLIPSPVCVSALPRYYRLSSAACTRLSTTVNAFPIAA